MKKYINCVWLSFVCTVGFSTNPLCIEEKKDSVSVDRILLELKYDPYCVQARVYDQSIIIGMNYEAERLDYNRGEFLFLVNKYKRRFDKAMIDTSKYKVLQFECRSIKEDTLFLFSVCYNLLNSCKNPKLSYSKISFKKAAPIYEKVHLHIELPITSKK